MIRCTRGIVSVAALVGLLAAHSHAGEGLDSIVPNDCVMFVRLKSPEALGQQLKETALGQALMNTEISDAALGLASNAARLFSSVAMGVPMAEIRSHFLTDLGIVVFDLGSDPKKAPPIALLLDVSRDPARAKALIDETIVPRLRAISPKLSVSKENYKGITIQKIQARAKPPLHWTFIRHVLVTGNPEGVRKVIDGTQNPSQALAQFEPYLAAKGAADVDVGAMCYINTQILLDKVRPLLATRQKQREGLTMAGVLSAKAVAVSTRVKGDGMQDRFYVYTGGDKMGLLRLAAQEPATDYAAARLVPEDHHLCVSAKLSSGPALFAAIKGMLLDSAGQEKVQGMAQFAQMLEQQAAIDWQAQFIDALAGELFFAMRMPNFAELAMERRGPGPKDFDIIVGVSLQNQDAIRMTLDKLFQSEFAFNAGLTLTPQDYKGHELSVISLPKNDKVSPCYTFEQNCFVLALSPETLERFIDRLAEKRVLSSSADFNKCQAQISGKGNVMAYADLREIIGMLLQLAETKAPPPVRAFMPELKALPESLFGMAVTLKAEPQGISGQGYDPVGGVFAISTLAGLGNLTKSGQGRRAQAAVERMKKVRNLLRRHHRQNQAYPQTLDAFVGKVEENVLLDPFREGQQLEYAQTGNGWILASVGPDGKLDIDLATWKPDEWKAKLRSADPATIAQVKALIYQYNKKRHPDEQSQDDEGDIVLVGP